MLYTWNRLVFHHPSDANMFVHACTEQQLAQKISNLGLTIRAQDTRLWMPYIMSRDRHRSLEADFPSLRELHVRFRSAEWRQDLSPENNMRLWSEDSLLHEVVDGIRNIYIPSVPRKRKNSRKEEISVDEGRLRSKPTIKVTCACRVNSAHFDTLTSPLPDPDTEGAHLPDLSLTDNGTGVIQQTPPMLGEATTSPIPIHDGEPFRGFNPIDLQTNPVKTIDEPKFGLAHVAHTPFADKNGILLSLEIHVLEPRKDNG